ncbi:hypothetical protein [Mastigocoleus testarum]|nr:hypothetical protein [Mastigocoleus testarum]
MTNSNTNKNKNTNHKDLQSEIQQLGFKGQRKPSEPPSNPPNP